MEQAARVPERNLITLARYPLSRTISHSHGLRRDRSPFSRRVMDHRGVADRCPTCSCCVIAAAMRHTVRAQRLLIDRDVKLCALNAVSRRRLRNAQRA